MRPTRVRLLLPALAVALAAVVLLPPGVDSACCYFSAKDKDILQPAQKAFITWDPTEKVESFTVYRSPNAVSARRCCAARFSVIALLQGLRKGQHMGAMSRLGILPPSAVFI